MACVFWAPRIRGILPACCAIQVSSAGLFATNNAGGGCSDSNGGAGVSSDGKELSGKRAGLPKELARESSAGLRTHDSCHIDGVPTWRPGRNFLHASTECSVCNILQLVFFGQISKVSPILPASIMVC